MIHSNRIRRSSSLARAITLELMEARRLLATVSGTVFYDDDLDGIVEAGEGGVSGWAVYADVNGNNTFDGSNSSHTSTNVPLAINDSSTITSNLPISGNGGTVNSVRVTINLTHTWDADLDIYLISPAGTRVELSTDNGSSGDNYTNTVFDDTAATQIINGTAPFTGSFKPEGSLASVAGQAIDGTWKLEVTDDTGSDVGTLNGWSLNFSSGEASAASNATGAYTLAGVPAGSYNIYLVPQPSFQLHRTSAAVSLATSSSTVSGVNFGVRQAPGSISGVVYADYNVNGVQDAGEDGISGRTVYVDLDNDSQLDAGEPSQLTSASGAYTFTNLRPGQRYIRTILPNKWFQTSPTVGGLMGVSPSGANDTATPKTPKMSHVADQMIIGINSRSRLDAALGKAANRSLRSAVSMQSARALGDLRGESILIVRVNAGSDSAKIAEQFKQLAGVNWAQPNYSYADSADPREYVPNDPSYASQWHHGKMQNSQAWDIAEGAGIRVGVTDDGAQTNHPDLVDNLYVNTGEIAGNGIDDDGNGYIDDRNGWDFTNSTTTGTGDNNPNPAVTSDNHGTHVIGTIGARTNNGLGIAGTAGRATIVPLRFYGTGTWTSTVIWNTYKYAADNGIKVLSTSYNVDGFANDNLFAQALNYLYDNGVLHFNSAGNNSQLNPARQKFDQSLYVAATTSTDAKASFSNYGTGIDISAPGNEIFATSTSSGYVSMSGTSMATPNAAAVAALIWSAHPTWTRDQVAAQLLGLADNIDTINPTFANLLGTGRVNSYRSLSQTLAAPKFRGVLGLPAEGGNSVTSPTQVRVQFFNVLDAATANNMANWTLIGAGNDDAFGTADDVSVPLSLTGNSLTYKVGTNEFLFNIGGTLTSGLWRFSASNLTDPFGTALDGNGDGTGGDAFRRTFSISGVTVAFNTNLLPGEDKLEVSFGTRESIAPTVVSSIFEFETGLAIKYVFSEDMTDLTDASILLMNTTTNQVVSASAYDVSFDHATRTATVFIDHHIVGGQFTATLVGDNTSDRFGNKLDGDANNSAGGNHTYSFMFVQGDVNRDGVVGFDDLVIMAQNYGQSGKTFTQGNADFDAAGNVGFDDLVLLAQQYGNSAVTASGASTRNKSRFGNVAILA